MEKFLQNPVDVADSFFSYGGTEYAESYGLDISGYQFSSEQSQKIAVELRDNIPASHIGFYADLLKTVTFGDYMSVHAGVRPGVALNDQADHDLM